VSDISQYRVCHPFAKKISQYDKDKYTDAEIHIQTSRNGRDESIIDYLYHKYTVGVVEFFSIRRRGKYKPGNGTISAV